MDSSAQLAWKEISASPPATGGRRSDFPNLPAWIVKAVGVRPRTGRRASLRFQEHEFKTLSTYGSWTA